MRVQQQVNSLYRELFSKMVASLTSYFGISSLALAEDLVQETFVTALEHFEAKGLPDDPRAWLFKVCKNKALNSIANKKEQPLLDSSLKRQMSKDLKLENLFLDHEIADSQLRLLFAACHPSLSPKAQVIFVLRFVCGLTSQEIGRALAMSYDAVTKSLFRSREVISQQDDMISVPSLQNAQSRLQAVHLAIYLLFSEGYSATSNNEVIRKDLCLEALRLGKSVLDISNMATPDTFALMALMCYHAARFDSRVVGSEIIALDEQDRSRWDLDLIKTGNMYFQKTVKADPSRFILEAAIAFHHVNALSFEATEWINIADLYSVLAKFVPSPFNDLNRAIALFYAGDEEKANAMLAESAHSNWLQNYHLYHAFIGKMMEKNRNFTEAYACYTRAAILATAPADIRYLKRKAALSEDLCKRSNS